MRKDLIGMDDVVINVRQNAPLRFSQIVVFKGSVMFLADDEKAISRC